MANREQDTARFANTVLAAVLAMPAPRVAFSDKTAAAIPLLAKGQTIVRDADLPGFFILVGTRGKTYMVQADLWAERKR